VSELILNAVWASMAILAFALVKPRRRGLAAMAALAAILIILFPIVSISDDFASDQISKELVAALLVVAGFLLILAPLAPVEPEAQLVRLDVRATHTDPRSPPRR
jgi:hypothetical protein